MIMVLYKGQGPALNALMAETGIDVEMGKKVLTAIGTGLVPSVRIHY